MSEDHPALEEDGVVDGSAESESEATEVVGVPREEDSEKSDESAETDDADEAQDAPVDQDDESAEAEEEVVGEAEAEEAKS